ncbi:hypothetical protein [Mesorhizobium carmichaelinearum]|uniref:hypothetical protein n=1 Tax=Mesorhizobium carmichaelinearum TaxID=1208188 RepID=UPI00117FAA3F|nr:hypothetical protein [Mesorhizobium carmichaelinearum]
MSNDLQIRLPSDDQVARCAIYPKFLTENRAFDPRILFRLQNKKSPFELSVAHMSDLPGSAVHEYGCNAAAIANQREGAEVSHYLGYYRLAVSDAEAASNDIYDVLVVRAPEHGADAHCHIVVSEKAGVDQNAPKKEYKVFVIDDLWNRVVGPQRHICPVDEAVRLTLEAIELPPRP